MQRIHDELAIAVGIEDDLPSLGADLQFLGKEGDCTVDGITVFEDVVSAYLGESTVQERLYFFYDFQLLHN